MNKIYIVGIGPGSSEYLTKKAIETVKNSDITVGSERAIELFDDIQEKISFNVKDLVEKLEEAVELAINGSNVSILSTGDPGFSGVLKTVLRIADKKGFNKENIEVIPGISSLQLAKTLELSPKLPPIIKVILLFVKDKESIFLEKSTESICLPFKSKAII